MNLKVEHARIDYECTSYARVGLVAIVPYDSCIFNE